MVAQTPSHTNWTPFQRQQDVYNAITSAPVGSYSLIGYGGAAGGGKTYLLAELAYDLATVRPGMRVLVGRRNFVDLKTTTLEKFDELIHPALIVKKYDSAPVYRQVRKPEWGPGEYSTIFFRGVERARDNIGSEEYGDILLEEGHEIATDDFLYLFSRMRHSVAKKFSMVVAFNPFPGFCTSTFITNKTTMLEVEGMKVNVVYIPSRMTDNPFLPPQYEGFLRSMYPKPLADRLILGIPGATENAVYSHFDRDVHYVPIPPSVRWIGGVVGLDYGEEHNAALSAIRFDQFNRGWIVECWAEPAEDHGASMLKKLELFRRLYRLTRGRTDPTQGFLAGRIGASVAKTGPGTRNRRTTLTGRRFNIFQGGRVPPYSSEISGYQDNGPYEYGEDSPGLFVARYALDDPRTPEQEALCEEIEGYQFVRVESTQRQILTVRRVAEDRIASVEYGIEEWEEPGEAFLFTETSAGALEPYRYRPEGQVAPGRRVHERGF